MTQMNDQNREEGGGEVRRPYSPPRLTVYGRVRDLTAGGSEIRHEKIREGIALDNGRS